MAVTFTSSSKIYTSMASSSLTSRHLPVDSHALTSLSKLRITFYIGAVRREGTPQAEKLHADQQRLFAHLKKHHLRYSLGYLLKSDGVFHEKGVDVQIAVDILVPPTRSGVKTSFLFHQIQTCCLLYARLRKRYYC